MSSPTSDLPRRTSSTLSPKVVTVGSPRDKQPLPATPSKDSLDVEELRDEGQVSHGAKPAPGSPPNSPKKSAESRPTHITVKTADGTPKSKSPKVKPGMSPASAVVSPSGLVHSFDGVSSFHGEHTFRRYATPMCVGLVCVAIAIIVMTVGVIPWRDRWRRDKFEACTLNFANTDCAVNSTTTVCWSSQLSVTVTGGSAVTKAGLCSIVGPVKGRSADTSSQNAIAVSTGVASLVACEDKVLPTYASYDTPPSAIQQVVKCLRNTDTGDVNLDPWFSSHNYGVMVFCIIIFCIFALCSLVLFIPLFRMLNERVEWYVLTPAPGSSKTCTRLWYLHPCWLLCLAILFFPLLAFYVVMFIIVLIIEGLHKGVGMPLCVCLGTGCTAFVNICQRNAPKPLSTYTEPQSDPENPAVSKVTE